MYIVRLSCNRNEFAIKRGGNTTLTIKTNKALVSMFVCMCIIITLNQLFSHYTCTHGVFMVLLPKSMSSIVFCVTQLRNYNLQSGLLDCTYYFAFGR